jgi:hypothetical protein
LVGPPRDAELQIPRRAAPFQGFSAISGTELQKSGIAMIDEMPETLHAITLPKHAAEKNKVCSATAIYVSQHTHAIDVVPNDTRAKLGPATSPVLDPTGTVFSTTSFRSMQRQLLSDWLAEWREEAAILCAPWCQQAGASYGRSVTTERMLRTRFERHLCRMPEPKSCWCVVLEYPDRR